MTTPGIEQLPPNTARVIAPPPLIYAGPLVVALLLQRRHPVQILPSRLSLPLGILAIACGLIALPALAAFRRAKTRPEPWKPTTALVTDGPYRFTRNPMYLGFTLLYLGITSMLNTAWSIILLPLVLVVMHYGVIAREEAYLERVFGEEYRKFKRRVRRWL